MTTTVTTALSLREVRSVRLTGLTPRSVPKPWTSILLSQCVRWRRISSCRLTVRLTYLAVVALSRELEQGKLKVNEDVHMIGVNRRHRPTTVTGIETFHKQLDIAEAGDNVGVLLRGVLKE